LRWSLLAFALVVACSDGPPEDFVDHTAPGFETKQAFLDFADLGQIPVQAKFVTTNFYGPSGVAAFLDPHFYKLHDEWYWFRLLNGVGIPALDVQPDTRFSFPTIESVYAELTLMEDLPLDLRWFGDRIASPHFYDLALGRCWESSKPVPCPRFFGVGSVLYLAPNPDRNTPEELWVFELEYTDEPTEAEVGHFFTRLEPLLPPDVELRWLSRTSSFQEALAEFMERGDGPYAKRVLTYNDLVTPGETVGYNPGITAGHIVRVPKGALGSSATTTNDIVLLADVPDELPPVAGIVTGVPQTPQAHFNLLAIARGTPNVYVGGSYDDTVLGKWAKDGTAVILKVEKDKITWQQMSQGQWQLWLSKTKAGQVDIEQIDIAAAPYFHDLLDGDVTDVEARVPLVGGKSAGLMALAADETIPTPFQPLSITVRAYHEHMAPLRAQVESLISNPEFDGERRARFLLLEGETDFVAHHEGDSASLTWLEEFKAAPHTANLKAVLAAGGLREMIRDQPIEQATLSTIREQLEERFTALSHSQGLRFRSSSTAEDVEGFNGAGVYTSKTGFLFAEEQDNDKDRGRTIQKAIKKVWASYWSFGAFEERKNGNVPHLDGNMGVLVHPRFDDPLEAANGVMLVGFARDPELGDRIELTVNVQAGAVSVTNPPPGLNALPEVDRVSRTGDGELKIERVQASNQSEGDVFTDEELTWLFDRMVTFSEAWLDARNVGLTEAGSARSVVLDLEFRKMKAGWPAVAEGAPFEPRIVIKQVRPLSRPIRIAPAEYQNAQVPPDVLATTERVVLRTCTFSAGTKLELLEFYTDPGAAIIDNSIKPFDAEVRFNDMIATHAEVSVTHPNTTADHWDIEITGAPADWDAETLTVDQDGAWTLGTGDEQQSGKDAQCTTASLVLTPTAWLQALLDQEQR